MTPTPRPVPTPARRPLRRGAAVLLAPLVLLTSCGTSPNSPSPSGSPSLPPSTPSTPSSPASPVLPSSAGAPSTPSDVPSVLRVPAGQELYLRTEADGVQIYDCTAKAEAPGGYEWVLTAPEATLRTADGAVVGRHYAGPTWESTQDHSAVVGAVAARDPGPDTTAVPWLLLQARSTSGAGLFSQARSVQRLHTVGGAAPSLPCGAGTVGERARVAYRASYYFYR